jgi:hypothetical protein
MRFMKAAARFVIEAWRAATPAHFLYTFMIALAWGALTVASASGFSAEGFLLTPSINALLSMQFNGFAVLLAVLVADHAGAPLARRPWPYFVAVVLGAAVGTTVFWIVSQRVLGLAGAYYRGAGYEPFASFGFRHGRHALIVCGVITFVYVSARWAAQRRAALNKLQLERMEAEKRLVESTLAATKARVEPAFLQTALARIDALYESQPAEADAALRDLIAHLREAISRRPDFP